LKGKRTTCHNFFFFETKNEYKVLMWKERGLIETKDEKGKERKEYSIGC
jgi:hypothetical protein